MGRDRCLRILCVGAHPDDVELFCGGTAARMAGQGAEVTILDMTRGERGTYGNPELRREEAEKASEILGAAHRENLDLGDAVLEESVACRHKAALFIRKFRPDIILAPYWEERHPDHAATGKIIRSACFAARLSGLDLGAPPFAAGMVLYYPSHDYVQPDIVVDISDYFQTKMEAIKAYRSQFPAGGRKKGVRPIGPVDYPWYVESRARHFGSLANCSYGEGYITPEPLKMDLSTLIVDRGYGVGR